MGDSGVEIKDKWDKWNISIGMAAKILIPIILVVIGWKVNSSIKDKEINFAMIRIAVGILKEKPDKDSSLREWSIDVINKYSEIKFEKGAKEELKTKPLPKSLTVSSGSTEYYIPPSFSIADALKKLSKEEREQLRKLFEEAQKKKEKNKTR